MNSTLKLDKLTKTLVLTVVIVHLLFFILEALLWMNPFVHDILLELLNNPVNSDNHTQALTLKSLFINQGFYNLFLVVCGLAGLYQLKKQNYGVGYALLLFMCFAGAGAGIVLACSTKAYLLAFFQAVPAAVAFFRIYGVYQISINP